MSLRGVSRSFSRGDFELFLYKRENLEGFQDFFFLENPSKLKKIPNRGLMSLDPSHSLSKNLLEIILITMCHTTTDPPNNL